MSRMRRLAMAAALLGIAALVSGCALLGMGPGIHAVASEDPLLSRAVRTAHIMYSPNHDPRAAVDLPLTDPAWAVAEAAARRAAATLRAIPDPAARAKAFADLATMETDDAGSGQQGGDLGALTRLDLPEPFGDAVFDRESPQQGDIIGPVRSVWGWHVIMYEGEGDPADAGNR